MSIAVLLARLEGVKHCEGSGWRADCPLGHRSRGTLAIAEGDDGRILLHCFALCYVADVLAKIGLEAADLFPEQRRDDSPKAGKTVRQAFKQAAWAAALGVLGREAEVLTIAAHDLAAG